MFTYMAVIHDAILAIILSLMLLKKIDNFSNLVSM